MTQLGERLKQIREAAVAKGMRLLSEDEVLEELKQRRSGVASIVQTGDRTDNLENQYMLVQSNT